ncbi:hypothetical protein ACFVX9_30360 [Kitasatospora sp. NPDC058243]|uniref:hypothetical protein n=1 Tax=Kitasatospora sp. NPDC058243 TaxID=3346397 RepID=UPI0036DEAFAE
MKYLVSAPRPDFQGAIVGVHFRDGAATVDPTADNIQRAALQYFQRANYSMVAVEETPAEPEPGSSPESTEDLFDPNTRSVEEVLAHLADADADEQARVLAAEAAGKARTTITSKGDQS